MLCGVSEFKDLFKKQPPITDDQIHTGKLVCTVQNFRIDFIRPWKTTLINQEARHIFIHHFLAAREGGDYADEDIPSRLLTAEQIGSLLDAHMEYRRKCYRQCLSPPDEATVLKKKKRLAMNTRRRTVSGIDLVGVIRSILEP